MKYPKIGIVPQIDITNPFRHVRLFPQYQRSIERVGAIGYMLPFTQNIEIMKEMAKSFDGFLFTGGQDLNPILYGQTELRGLKNSTGYAPERDIFEPMFYPIVRDLNKPVLAICRGFQVINVIQGGTIIQDLPTDKISHSYHDTNQEGHSIILQKGTKLSKIFNSPQIKVNSFHHQGIGLLGENLTVSGISPDGLIEAFDIDDLDFGIAVQWHPEVLYDNNYDDGKLFKAFIDYCKGEFSF